MKTPPQGAVDALILAQTRELHLPSVGARYGELADEAAREGTPHRDYLAHLFEMELDDRGQRRAERRLQEARFPHRKRLEDFNFEQSQVNAALLHQSNSSGKQRRRWMGRRRRGSQDRFL